MMTTLCSEKWREAVQCSFIKGTSFSYPDNTAAFQAASLFKTVAATATTLPTFSNLIFARGCGKSSLFFFFLTAAGE
jgi:hypothetical protein